MIELYKALASERNERLNFLAVKELKRSGKPESTNDFISYIEAIDDNTESDRQMLNKLRNE